MEGTLSVQPVPGAQRTARGSLLIGIGNLREAQDHLGEAGAIYADLFGEDDGFPFREGYLLGLGRIVGGLAITVKEALAYVELENDDKEA